MASPESLLTNNERVSQPQPFSAQGMNYDEDGYLISDSRDHAKPDPNLASFVGDTSFTNDSLESLKVEIEEPISSTNNFVADESMTREQFNIANQINSTPDSPLEVGSTNPIQQPDDAFVPFDLETGVFEEESAKQIHKERVASGRAQADMVSKMVYTKADEMIDPAKR
ncbi:hypothetical protein Zmor_009038, partial [Zophobas morio]